MHGECEVFATFEGNEFIIFSIWTNGSISPEDAIYETCKILVDSFSSIMKNQFIDKIGLKDQIQKSELLSSLEIIEPDQNLIKTFKNNNTKLTIRIDKNIPEFEGTVFDLMADSFVHYGIDAEHLLTKA